MNYFDWAADKLFHKLLDEPDVVEYEPPNVSEMQGIVVGVPSVDQAKLLMTLFGRKKT